MSSLHSTYLSFICIYMYDSAVFKSMHPSLLVAYIGLFTLQPCEFLSRLKDVVLHQKDVLYLKDLSCKEVLL